MIAPRYALSQTPIHRRTRLALGLSLIATAAFAVIFWLVGFGPTGIADDFYHGRSYPILDGSSQLLLVFSIIVWAIAFLVSMVLELSVIRSGSHDEQVMFLPTVAVTTTLLVMQLVLIVIGRQLVLPKNLYEYTWNLITIPSNPIEKVWKSLLH